jgi:SNF2 family DNA or RNA helicase
MKRERQERVLYPHQEVGVLRILHGFCTATYQSKGGVHKPTRSILLHDDMGLGKTIQALEALRRMMESDRLRLGNLPTLILAPAACLHVWQAEISAWFADYFTDVRLFINDSADVKTLQRMTYRTIIITSYSTLRTAFQSKIFAVTCLSLLF